MRPLVTDNRFVILPELSLTREFAQVGADRDLRRLHQSGVLTKIDVGVYVATDAWRALGPDDRYRLRIHARARLDPELQISHESAAALHELPILGAWPSRVHALAPRSNGGRSGVGLVRHCVGLDDSATRIDGILVTSLPRTLVDLACSRNFLGAIVAVDAGLARSTSNEELARAGLAEALDALDHPVGHARARRAIDFATAQSGSPGESVSRVQFQMLGIPPPQLQVPFFDRNGLIGIVDFWWPEFGLVGEFDGAVKYGDQRKFDRDISARAVLLKEKDRGDRLAREVRSVARWGWDVAQNRRLLAARLRDHGMPI